MPDFFFFALLTKLSIAIHTQVSSSPALHFYLPFSIYSSFFPQPLPTLLPFYLFTHQFSFPPTFIPPALSSFCSIFPTCLLPLPASPLSNLVDVHCPRGEDHVAGLLVEGEPLDVHVTDGGEDSVSEQCHFAIILDDDVGVNHGVLVA